MRPTSWRRAWMPLGAVAITALAFIAFLDTPLRVDEAIHYPQIRVFSRGYSRIDPRLTMIPGYHAILGAMTRAVGLHSVKAVRCYTFILASGAIAAFYWAAKVVRSSDPVLKTLQFLFLPIAFPLLFLIYTDMASVLFVLLMVAAALARRPQLAGAFGLLSCLIRQNNIIWAAFVLLLSFVAENGWSFDSLPRSLRRYWLFAVTGMLFVVFVYVNRGVAIGDVGMHPLGAVHLGNVFFLLFLCFFLFLPLLGALRHEVFRPLASWKGWLGLALLFVVFWLGFSVDHPYNLQQQDLFMRNALLAFFASGPSLKLLFFLPVCLAALFIRAAPIRRHWWLLYPFTVVFLLPAWLIEQRYYLVPLTLFLLAREPLSLAAERAQLAWFALLSVSLFVVVERGWMFI